MSESAIHRIGKYEILGKLGDGATSVVYLAKDEFNDRQVAIKLVSQTALKDQNRGQLMHRLFLTEASLAGKLNHPHIVEIYDAVADEENAIEHNFLNLRGAIKTPPELHGLCRWIGRRRGRCSRSSSRPNRIAQLDRYGWRGHFRGLFQTPVAAQTTNSPPTGGSNFLLGIE